jgi:mono/diheme cytochrome c family protein
MKESQYRSRSSTGSRSAFVASAAFATVIVLGASSAVSTAGPVAAEEATAKQVERGRYLVRTTGCNDCHTPGYIENAGRLDESRWLIGNALGWQGPWGTTYPANLRLLTQGLTADQWLLTARRQTRPPMPWFSLRDMTDADLLAIYHFTRSLGPAGRAAPAFLPPGKSAHTPVVKIPG